MTPPVPGLPVIAYVELCRVGRLKKTSHADFAAAEQYVAQFLYDFRALLLNQRDSAGMLVRKWHFDYIPALDALGWAAMPSSAPAARMCAT